MKPQNFDKLPAEERFRLLIQEVSDRVQAAKLEKDDYQTYSELQTDLDTFMSEAINDINKIKSNFKKKFNDIQKRKP